MVHTISNGKLTVSAAQKGAELTSVKLCGEEKLWQRCDAWDGSAPILFPYCGKTTVSIGGENFPVIPHGFAWVSEFALVEKNAENMTFLLSDSENTRKYYPFSFDFYVTYAINDNRLDVTYRVKNKDEKTLWFASGGHESFVLKYPIEQYKFEFEKDEKFDSLVYKDGLTGDVVNFGEGKILPMPMACVTNSDTAIFGNINSRKVGLIAPDGKTVNEFFFDGFGNLLLWRPGNANMICVEPWQNLPDDVSGKPREFSEVKGAVKVESGSEKSFTRQIYYY